jgi:methyl-accepting chemotaxis protein
VGNIQQITDKISEEEIPKLGATFENMNGITENIDDITASIQQLSETEIKEIANNIEEITSKINEDLAKVDDVVTTTTDFTKNTIEKAEFYRDKLFVPIIDILSFWNAIKVGLANISQIRQKNLKNNRGGDLNG